MHEAGGRAPVASLQPPAHNGAAKIIGVVKGRLPETMAEMVDARDEQGHPIGGFDEEPVDPRGQPYAYALEEGQPVAICYERDGGEGEDGDIRWPRSRS